MCRFNSGNPEPESEAKKEAENQSYEGHEGAGHGAIVAGGADNPA